MIEKKTVLLGFICFVFLDFFFNGYHYVRVQFVGWNGQVFIILKAMLVNYTFYSPTLPIVIGLQFILSAI